MEPCSDAYMVLTEKTVPHISAVLFRIVSFKQTAMKRRLYAIKLALFATSGPLKRSKYLFNSINTDNQDWMHILRSILLLCHLKVWQLRFKINTGARIPTCNKQGKANCTKTKVKKNW